MGLIRTVEADLLKNPFVPSEDDGADTYEMVCESFDASQPDDARTCGTSRRSAGTIPAGAAAGKSTRSAT